MPLAMSFLVVDMPLAYHGLPLPGFIQQLGCRYLATWESLPTNLGHALCLRHVLATLCLGMPLAMVCLTVAFPSASPGLPLPSNMVAVTQCYPATWELLPSNLGRVSCLSHVLATLCLGMPLAMPCLAIDMPSACHAMVAWLSLPNKLGVVLHALAMSWLPLPDNLVAITQQHVAR
ncbi:hypothetical protein RHMOL_Rhmol10G0189900 [Rhododendron molle]|uniref:Uncharacterized protein n=1 Tax=Rhododendron molle TaxID=49168 RepID=A0ACC0M4Y8_RHOML|nr:hypothetical protein RHMOL_Rhmol10G0189900 [Rhododendron molle]